MSQSVIPQLFELLLNLVGGIGGLILFYRFIAGRLQRRRRRRAFLGLTSERYIAIGSSPDGSTVRTPDAEALAELRDRLRDERVSSTCYATSAVSPIQIQSRPLILLGSPRYNSLVDELQRRLDTPFQFVSLTPEQTPDKSILCVYARTGQQFACTADASLGEVERGADAPCLGEEYDYGILLVGEINDEKSYSQRVFWAGGIHGIGTLGVMKWAIENLDKYDWAQLGNVCFLIRVGFSVPLGHYRPSSREHEHIDQARPELVFGPYSWQPREEMNQPIGILCDMGSVLLSFERKRFEHNLRHMLGIQPSKQQIADIEVLRGLFESGHRTEKEFPAEIRQILNLSNGEDILRVAWCDIFWRHEQVISYLEKLSKVTRAKLVLISNTDPLRLEYALSRLELDALFERNSVVASFEVDVRPKGEDNSMLMKALRILREQFQTQDFTAIFVDDVRTYLIMAREGGLGIRGIHYRSFPQLVYDLRNYGLYLPISK